MEVRSELWCHECGSYVQFTYDDSLNGNHVIKCPKYGHEHCRVIKDGEVTDDRWDSRNGQQGAVFSANYVTVSYKSIELSVANCSSNADLGDAWVQSSYYSAGATTVT